MRSNKSADQGARSRDSRSPVPPSQSPHTGAVPNYQRLQQTLGNRATAELLAGLKVGVDPKEYLSGRTLGEVLGDVGRPVGTAVGNAVAAVAGALTGITVSTTTNSGPTWNNHGQFGWSVGFTTSGRNGWLVQEITNTYRADDATGNPVPGARPTPHLWEAWAVDAAGNVTPNAGAVNDRYIRPSQGTGTEGHWSVEGKVYFTTINPATQGFTAGGVPDAGILLSTTTAPTGLGVARLHRYAQGHWDSLGPVPTHTGRAR